VCAENFAGYTDLLFPIMDAIDLQWDYGRAADALPCLGDKIESKG
jgi:hypothetical protein